MSLRNQIAAVLLALSILLVASTYIIQTCVVLPVFADLEFQGAGKDLARCIDSLERDLEALTNSASDWSGWDASYQFVQGNNPTYIDENLMPETFQTSKINLLCFLDNQSRMVWGEVRDLPSLEKRDEPELFKQLASPHNPLVRCKLADHSHSGLVKSTQGPLLVVACPILTSKREGPSTGVLMMGRFLNSREIESLAQRTHLDLKAWTVQDPSLPKDAARYCRDSFGREEIQPINSDLLVAYTGLKDVYGNPTMVLRVTRPRHFTQQGTFAARIAAACSLSGGILTLLFVGIFLQKRLIGPLQKMARHAVNVGQTDNLDARLNESRADEIGTLAREFDEMVGRLAESRQKQLQSAHRAGMAEIASHVLHNVGNALNSANASVETLEVQAQASKVSGLTRATHLLLEQKPNFAQFFENDPRGPQWVGYLSDLTAALETEHADSLVEIKRLRTIVQYMRDVMSAQQTYAQRTDFRQTVDLPTLIEEAIDLNHDEVQALGVAISVQCPSLPTLSLNKSKLIQVLVNLIRNAVRAMDELSDCERRMIIRVRIADETDVEISVQDTGKGFDAASREKLFNHGYTTRADGQGYGLHYCASALQEMGGNISAHSDGVGLGATFRIRLPDVLPAPSLETAQ